jgi:hypothetical protein
MMVKSLKVSAILAYFRTNLKPDAVAHPGTAPYTAPSTIPRNGALLGHIPG